MAERYPDIQIEKLNLLGDDLEASLQALFARSEAMHPQYGEDWLKNLARHALDEGEVAVLYTARRGSDELAVLPMTVDSARRQAQALGNFYTSQYSPLVRAEPDSAVLLFSALFEYLAIEEGFSRITLSPMADNSPLLPTLISALGRTGWKGVHKYYCFGNWVHSLEGACYDTYLQSRPSRVKNTVTRKTKKFIAAGRGSLSLVTGGAELEQAIAQYVDIYNSSWKQEEPYPEFVPHLLRMAAAKRWLRLGIASYDQRPIAAQIWLVSGDTAYIFKLAYHQDYAQLSPGTVLTAYMLQHVIDTDGVAKIDYLSGDDSYKQDWMSARHERHGIAAYNPRTLAGSAAYLARGLKVLAQRLRGGEFPRRSPDSGPESR